MPKNIEQPISVDELFTKAVNSYKKPGYRDVILKLHTHSGREVLNKAQAFCADSDPKKRIIGIDTLAELGHPKSDFTLERAKTLLSLLETETNEEVLEAITY